VVLNVEGGTVREVPVTEGLSNGTQVQITTGLKTGDIIVADARRDVAAGTKVNPIFVK
jgi:HlyD family secretion protein